MQTCLGGIEGGIMISVWWHVALVALSIFSGVAVALALALIGGVGVISALTKRIEGQEIGLENLERRLTTEVKARAGVKGVEARQERKSVEEQARVQLASESLSTGSRRPSIVRLLRK